VERYGKYVLMSHHDLDRMTVFFGRYGSITVLLARLLPVVRTFIAFPRNRPDAAGPLPHLYVSGSWPWCFVLLCGHEAGRKVAHGPRFYAVYHRFHLGVELAFWRDCVVCLVARERGRRRKPFRARRKGVHCSVRRIRFLLNCKKAARKGRLGETMETEQQGGQKTAEASKIAPATGKLGVMVVGLGAVATTLIAGVEAVRKGLAKPIGSLTQMGTIRLGKRTDNKSPLIKDFVPLAI